MDRPALLDLLARTRSRGQVKALGASALADKTLAEALRSLAVEQGAEDAQELEGKALVRRVLDRQAQAQVRRNPIHRDEAFTCAWCGAAVDPGGARVRDHCPWCLRSRHVDVVPGDRAADCGGLLHPVSMSLEGGEVVLVQRCARCVHQVRVRAHPQDRVPPGLDPADLPGEGAMRASGRARTLPTRLIEVIARHGLWQAGDRVLVAVSGGLDSTVLLELLWRTRAAHGAQLEVMSLDHGLRPEAAAEVAAVAAHAARLDLPMHTLRLDLSAGPGLAERAREARRQALRAVGADRIATAHHQDDQAETVLQRLLAGGGSAGLQGIRPLDPPWCRPLVEERRSVLRAWAEAEGLSWVEDPSNPGSERGRLRSLLDGLGQLRAGATAGLARSAGLLARDDAFLNDCLEAADPDLQVEGGLSAAVWSTLHPALQARALRRLCEAAGLVPRADTIDAVLRGARQVELGGGRALRIEGGVLRLV